MQLLFHLHLSNTKFAQKQLGKVTLREGKGTEPRGRYSQLSLSLHQLPQQLWRHLHWYWFVCQPSHL